MKLLKRYYLKATGFLQLCIEQVSDSEVAIHAVYEMFKKKAQAVLMLDASNTFNAINREEFLHNKKIICPSISTYINDCYASPTDQGTRSIKSEDGTAGTIVRDPHHRESPTRREQGLNLRRTGVQA